jgi:hypothetical protein
LLFLCSGFGGGSTLSRNLFFGTNDETGQGVFNSWDRQTYVTDVDVSPGTKRWDEITQNLMINSDKDTSRGHEAAMEAIDNDDGSSFYRTHSNVFAFSIGGMKNDFSGHDNMHYENLYAYIRGPAVDITTAMTPGHEDHFYNNSVVQTGNSSGLIARCEASPRAQCAASPSEGCPVVHDNQLYTPDGNGSECGGHGGMANGDSVAVWPTDEELIALAKQKLGMPAAERRQHLASTAAEQPKLLKTDDLSSSSHDSTANTDTAIFDVVWNSDLSQHCQSINKTLPLEQNGVRTNDNQSWFGSTIATLYNAGAAMPSARANGSLINGGIPQLADRGLIQSATRSLLRNALPSDFGDGIGVFDIEYPQLYPLWGYDFGPANQKVRQLAANFTAHRHPGLSGAALVNQTVHDFNEGMAELWQLQLQTAKELYPRGTFGYYRMPHCWYNNLHPFAPCNGATTDGDKLAWLWKSEGGIFPGAYFASGNDANASARLVSTVREAVRVAQVHGKGRPKVMPFVSYGYRGGSKDHQLLPPDMMWDMLSGPASLGAAGVVIWGGSGDAATVDCGALAQALNTIGPRLRALRSQLAQCAVATCSGHGRCATWYTPTQCVCEENWAGESCEKNVGFSQESPQ